VNLAAARFRLEETPTEEFSTVTVDVTDFEQQVLQASREGPVLVDFWAEWCGPCRQLGPILEKIAGEDGAGFTLAKVNTDHNPEVSQRYGIRSIPAVKLFADGEVVDEFIGALPEPQVRKWLEKAVPSESKQRVAHAQAAFDTGRRDEAAAILANVLHDEPANAAAQALLARCIAFDEPKRAYELVSQAARTDATFVPLSVALGTLAELADVNVESLLEDLSRASVMTALSELKQGDVDTALGAFVQAVRLNKRYEDELARRACLAVFAVLGDKDELTKKHRRALEMALF
jgi:putative thioredoxin